MKISIQHEKRRLNSSRVSENKAGSKVVMPYEIEVKKEEATKSREKKVYADQMGNKELPGKQKLQGSL